MFKPKDQIAYIPPHANDVRHPDVQFGFVTNVVRGTIFCRYFYTGLTGDAAKHNGTLRTRAYSEGCDPDRLVHYDHKPQEEIDALYESLYSQEVDHG